MHIPDGYLSPIWSLVTYAITLAYALIAIKKIKEHRLWTPANVSKVTLLAAAIFVAQMLNWPIPGGTSLHFVGGALAFILLGPWLGFLAMSMVIATQCLIFHDGGITALGANILNMAIVDGLVGYTIYMLARKYLKEKGISIGAFLGAWMGITLAGLVCGIEIGLSPSFPFGVAITVPVMTSWHFVLGIIEGVITAVAIKAARGSDFWRPLGEVPFSENQIGIK